MDIPFVGVDAPTSINEYAFLLVLVLPLVLVKVPTM